MSKLTQRYKRTMSNALATRVNAAREYVLSAEPEFERVGMTARQQSRILALSEVLQQAAKIAAQLREETK